MDDTQIMESGKMNEDEDQLIERIPISDIAEIHGLTIVENGKEDIGEGEKSQKGFKFSGVRYVILILTILSMASMRANDTSFSFTFICMTSNSSENNYEPVEMTATEKGILFGGSGVGAMLSVIFVVHALHYLGPRIVFTMLLLFSTIATLSLPSLAALGPIYILPARVMQGLSFSVVLPLIGCVSAQWAPLSEITRFVTLLSISNQLSQVISNPMSANLCVKSGWRSVFYTHGTISSIFAIVFFLIFRRSPHGHPAVKREELMHITSGEKRKKRPVPYMRILTTKSVWAVWIAFLGNGFGFQLILQFMPTFLNKVLGVPITRTGFAVIVPPLTQLCIKVTAGWLSDKITCITELTKIRIFNSIAMIGCGTFFIPLGYLPLITSNKSVQQLLAVLCFTSCTSCLGLVSCSSMKSATLIARDFSHFIMAAVQFLVSITMLCVPAVVNWLAPSSSLQEWRTVFFSFFTILFLCNAFFYRFCSAEAEPWALEKIPNVDSTSAIKNDEIINTTPKKSEIVTPLIINA